MFARVRTIAIGLAAALVASVAVVGPAQAGGRDKVFFDGVQGQWSGPGEFLEGKYKGTKFTCSLGGSSDNNGTGMTLDGSCRVGIFKQPMKAVVRSAGRTYKGQYLDGAKGNGLDIVSGNLTGQKFVMGINRAKINGAIIARLRGKNTMTVTVSIKVDDGTMVPLIGMNLNRDTDNISVGSVD